MMEWLEKIPGVYAGPLQIALLIVGVAIAMKAGKWWGWLFVAAALAWAYVIWIPYFR